MNANTFTESKAVKQMIIDAVAIGHEIIHPLYQSLS